MVKGIMKAIHSPKPMLMPISFMYLSAIAFGGVPIGVPIPPTLAEIGIARARAVLPFPSAGRALRTGPRKVSIIAAVAVFERNIEKIPVTRRKPRRTILGFLPKGLSITLARNWSRPVFEAAIARTNPPIKSMMIGSAKQ